MQAELTGKMSVLMRRIFKTVAVLAAVFVVLVVAIQAVAPLVVSSSFVRNAMEEELAEWTGHDVTIFGSPTLGFWPTPHIEVSRVAVTKPTDAGVRVLARVSRISADFSLFQAVGGEMAFNDFELQEPEIFIVRDENGRLDWASEGRLSDAVATAKGADGHVSLNPALDLKVGNVTIDNGRIEVRDSATGDKWRASGIRGSLTWPRLSQSASIDISVQINRRDLALKASSAQPLLLLAGQSAPIDSSLTSAGMSLAFNGTANLFDRSYLSGSVNIALQDASSVLAWAGIAPMGTGDLKQFSLTGQFLSSNRTLRLEDLDLAINTSHATGILDLALPQNSPPCLTGTLAFDAFDLSALLSATSPNRNHPSSLLQSATALELDLRISGKEMSLGPFLITEVALGVINERGQSRVDIVDGVLEGGRVTSQIVSADEKSDFPGSTRIHLRNANLQSVFAKLGVNGVLPQGSGSLELIAQSDLRQANDWDEPQGTFRIVAGPGVFANFDPITILQRAGPSHYVPLENPDGQDFSYERFDLSGSFKDGTADIQSAVIAGKTATVTLSGIVPFAEGGVALSASIAKTTEPDKEHVLFIGGSTSQPVAIAVQPPLSSFEP